MKSSTQIVKKGDTENRKAKEQARGEKANKIMNGSELCKLPRRQPFKKRAGWKMVQENSVQKSHSEERKELC